MQKISKKVSKQKVLIIVIVFIILLWIISFFSPELSIRRYILFKLHPISSINANISNMGIYNDAGHLYDVSGYKDWATGEDIYVFYLKKKGPFWVVTSTGSGP